MAAAMLIVFSGLPATGKSSVARALALRLDAVWLRIDSIEQAIRESGAVPGTIGDAGYRAAHAAAKDNLRMGRIVVADCVNPWMLTRNAWRDTGLGSGARVVEIETICSDAAEHRRRVEGRVSDVPGLVLPTWAQTMARDYHPWDRDHLVIDTAGVSIERCVEQAFAAIGRIG